MDTSDAATATEAKRISKSSNFIRLLFRFLALSWIISYFSPRFSTEAKSIALNDKAGKQLVLTSQNLENHNKLLEGRHKYGRHLKRRRLPVKRTISDLIGIGSQAAQEEEPVEASEVAADEVEEVASEVDDGNVSDDTYGFGSLAGSDRDENDGDESDYDWFGLGNDDDGDESDYDLFGSDNEADTDRRSGAKKNQKESSGQKTSKKNKQTDGDDEDGWFDW